MTGHREAPRSGSGAPRHSGHRLLPLDAAVGARVSCLGASPLRDCLPRPLSPAAGGGALGGGGGGSQAWWLYGCAHCTDCELRLGGHDVCGLDVAVVHWVLKCGPNVCVLVAGVAIERNFGSSPGNERERGRVTKTSKEGEAQGCERGEEGVGSSVFLSQDDSSPGPGRLWAGWGG